MDGGDGVGWRGPRWMKRMAWDGGDGGGWGGRRWMEGIVHPTAREITKCSLLKDDEYPLGDAEYPFRAAPLGKKFNFFRFYRCLAAQRHLEKKFAFFV